MICNPLSVSTVSLISLTFRANAASSNGFCIVLRPNIPKSPPARNVLVHKLTFYDKIRINSPRLADEQSLYFSANSANLAGSPSICLRYPSSSSCASSFVRVIGPSWRCDARNRNFIPLPSQRLVKTLPGRRDPACFTNKCAHWIFFSAFPSAVAGDVGTSHCDSFVILFK